MSVLEDIFGAGGKDVVKQIVIWQVLGQLIAPVLQPLVQEIANTIETRFPDVPISPADAADMVVKGHLSHDEGTSEANKSGISATNFDRLVQNTGEPISTQEALFLFRRQLMSGDRLTEAIRQSRVRDEWIPDILNLATVPLGVADAVDAVVEGQISHDEGARIAYENGVKGEDFTILVHTRGRPPTPSELMEGVRRGLIPLSGTGPDTLSLQQGIYEGATKDKWLPLYEALVAAVPPPRTVTALLRSQSIDEATARKLFTDAGLPAALADAYVHSATAARTSTVKTLTRATIEELYTAHAITHDQAHTSLVEIGYTAADADLLLTYVDLQRSLRAANAATSRVGTLYVARKIDRQQALGDLHALGMTPAQADATVAAWDVERASTLRLPSEAQIAAALHYGIITPEVATEELQAMGYTPWGAWLVLSVRMHGAVGPEPARDAVPAPW